MRKYLVTRFVAGLLIAAAIIVLILGVVSASALGLSGGWGPGSRVWLVVPIVIITFFNTALLLVFGALLFFLTRIEMNLDIVRGKGRPGRPRPRVAAPPPGPNFDRRPALPAPETPAEAAAVAGAVAVAGVIAGERAGTEPPGAEAAGAETAVVAEPPSAEEVAPETVVDAPPASEEALSSEAVSPEPPAEAPETSARLPGVEVFDDSPGETPAAEEVADDSGALKLPGADQAARIAREMAASRPAPLEPPQDGSSVEPPAPPEEPAS